MRKHFIHPSMDGYICSSSQWIRSLLVLDVSLCFFGVKYIWTCRHFLFYQPIYNESAQEKSVRYNLITAQDRSLEWQTPQRLNIWSFLFICHLCFFNLNNTFHKRLKKVNFSPPFRTDQLCLASPKNKETAVLFTISYLHFHSGYINVPF